MHHQRSLTPVTLLVQLQTSPMDTLAVDRFDAESINQMNRPNTVFIVSYFTPLGCLKLQTNQKLFEIIFLNDYNELTSTLHKEQCPSTSYLQYIWFMKLNWPPCSFEKNLNLFFKEISTKEAYLKRQLLIQYILVTNQCKPSPQLPKYNHYLTKIES